MVYWVVSEFATIYVRIYVCGLTQQWRRTQNKVQRQGSFVLRSGYPAKMFYFDRVGLSRMLPEVVPFVLFSDFMVSNSLY